MRAAIFLACALGTSSMATATGNLMTDLVLGLARDVHDARATSGGTATSTVRRRLRHIRPSSLGAPLKSACPRVCGRAARGAIVRCVACAAPTAGCGA